MNTKNITKGLLLGASLLLASAAFAGEKATVKVYEDVKVNGKTLPAGKYDLSWEGTGSNVQVNRRHASCTGRSFEIRARKHWLLHQKRGRRLDVDHVSLLRRQEIRSQSRPA